MFIGSAPGKWIYSDGTLAEAIASASTLPLRAEVVTTTYEDAQVNLSRLRCKSSCDPVKNGLCGACMEM